MIQEKLNQAIGMAGIARQLYKQTPEYQEKMRIKGLETERERLSAAGDYESKVADVARKHVAAYTDLISKGQHLTPEEAQELQAATKTYQESAARMNKYSAEFDELTARLGKLPDPDYEDEEGVTEAQKNYEGRVGINRINTMDKQLYNLVNSEVMYQANMQAQKKRQANKQRKAYAKTYASDSGFANYLRGVKGPEQGGNK